MVRIRYALHTKWNHAQEVIDAIKATKTILEQRMGIELHVLSDLTGPMHTIIEEFDLGSAAEWEQRRSEMFAMTEFVETMNAVAPYIEYGTLEIFTIEA